jgi:uncharacterized protein (TIGR03000 family)
MYSMVLMAALTAGTDVPDWGRRWGCHGCWGGWGWGCHGCWGCWGCWGGCGGGWGGCYGCGGCGGGYAWGGWGGYSAWGYAYAPVAVPYAAPAMLASNMPSTTVPATTVTRSMYPADTSADKRATLIVYLPEAATLTVDGKPTTSTSTVRRFYSPPLERGKNYYYTFTARMQRDGKEVKVERRVSVHAGDQREIIFTPSDFTSLSESRQAAVDERKATRARRLQVDQH